MWPTHSIASSFYKQSKSACQHKNLYTDVLAALLVVAKPWKQPKCPSTSEWVNKLWYNHIIEYYSAITMNELLILDMDETQNNYSG